MTTTEAGSRLSSRPAARLMQTAIGVALAAGVILSWLALHIFGVFFYTPSRDGWLLAPFLILVQGWLGVGLFIVAHDAMHASLAPGRPRWNEAAGRLATALYNPGFVYPKLRRNHHAHHRAPGTAEDPDFHPDRPHAYLPWFLRFFRGYFGWGEFTRLTVALCIYLFVLRAHPLNFFLFWAAPAWLSAFQLFTFGTWAPHRHAGEGAFADRHRARTLEFGWLLSLLTCFHFGYHLEHHRSPGTPWWALPRYRAERRDRP